MIKFFPLVFALCVSAVAADKMSQSEIRLDGQWIIDSGGKNMIDPQPSGLSALNNHLITLSDRSAAESQRLKIHFLNPDSAKVEDAFLPIQLQANLNQSCFADYLSNNPDLEALLVDPLDSEIFYSVTEDATYRPLSAQCQNRYAESGSTQYPSLLLKLKVIQEVATIIGVKPIKFAKQYRAGNFPNDGIEGLAIDSERQLYIGKEKDELNKPRIYQIALAQIDWNTQDFISVEDSNIVFPDLGPGVHPVNALTYYQPDISHPGFLIAAARNQDQIWFIDLKKKATVHQLQGHFFAPEARSGCGNGDKLVTTGIEGIAVKGNRLWLINDPWKEKYKQNIQCEAVRAKFESMSPMLFSLPLKDGYFDPRIKFGPVARH